MTTTQQNQAKQQNPNPNDLITHDMLRNMHNNYQILYKFVHPNGLTLGELAKKSEEYNIYRIVYKHILKEVYNGK